jgi:hypothetical protein
MLDEPLTAEAIPGRIQPRRPIEGISAVLLPFCHAVRPDYDPLEAHIVRTADAELTPVVNMDTGYVDRPPDRRRLCRTFSDCTAAPRRGLVLGCCSLDPFCKDRTQRERLKAFKIRLREAR